VSGVIINGAFRSQRVTGQQRYATEIADRLLAHASFSELRPEGIWTGSSAREWAWTLARLPLLARRDTLVSLTARAPIGVGQVLIVHDLFVLTNPEWYSGAYIRTHAPALRAQLRAAKSVVAVSEPTAELVRARFDGEVVVAPNAPSRVFATNRSDDADTVMDRLGVRGGSFLLTVGSLDPRKNLPALAQAYAALSSETRAQFPLVVVGGAAAIYRDESIAWPEGTIAAGYVSDDDLAVLYRGARAVVFPSLAEGFGLPLVEAAAAGAGGLVISDIPVFRWICGDGALYIDPASVSSITAGLSRAITDGAPPIAIEPGRFDWDASAATVAHAALSAAGAAEPAGVRA